MALKIYNTLTRRKEEFEPLVPDKVRMYVCGVTVYDMCHIGHARSIVLFDVIYRYLMHRGFDVTYVRNFTDIDDKIINRANERGENWKRLAERFIYEFYADMHALRVRLPTFEPKATAHMPQIRDLIAKLIASGHAYQAGGDVIFSVDSFAPYGKLSGKRKDELVAGARVEVDEKKNNPLDFVLWKAAKPGEPSWESPWGPGRPGWHIECSAMSTHYLGDGFDIHGGGADLAFPHHENEIAQSEAATGVQFARYWIHNGFVTIRSEKMAKSVGNVRNIREVLQEVHPEALRLFLLSSHYRSPIDYNESSIGEASARLERLYKAMAGLDELIRVGGQSDLLPEELAGITGKFIEAMDDDFNTARALAVISAAETAINRLVNEFAAAGESKESIPHPSLLEKAKAEIGRSCSEVLGILTEEPQAFLEALKDKLLLAIQSESGTARQETPGIDREEIERLIEKRAAARKGKDYAGADRIREELASKGIVLEDGPKGTTWRVKS